MNQQEGVSYMDNLVESIFKINLIFNVVAKYLPLNDILSLRATNKELQKVSDKHIYEFRRIFIHFNPEKWNIFKTARNNINSVYFEDISFRLEDETIFKQAIRNAYRINFINCLSFIHIDGILLNNVKLEKLFVVGENLHLKDAIRNLLPTIIVANLSISTEFEWQQ